MPIYDYRCSACGHEVEVIHPIGGAGPETCEVCGGAMRKALSAPAIHFKGSGWAKKDAKAGASKAKPAADASTASETGASAKKDGGSAADRGGSTGEPGSKGKDGKGKDGKAAAGAGSASG